MKPCDILLEHLRLQKTVVNNLKGCTKQPLGDKSHINNQKIVQTKVMPNIDFENHPLILKSGRHNPRQQPRRVPEKPPLLKKFT